MTMPNDPRIQTALAQAIGHAPPFEEQEYGAVQGPLVVVGARDLSALRRCTSLRHLEIYGSDAQDLGFLAELQQLTTLKLVGVAVEDLGPLGGLGALRELVLIGTLAQDAEPLLALRSLRTALLEANPWSDKSWDEQLPQLASTPMQPHNKVPLLRLTSRFLQQQTRVLQERGTRASFFLDEGGAQPEPVVIRAGCATLPDADCDTLSVAVYQLREHFKQASASWETLVAEFGAQGRPPRKVADLEFALAGAESEEARGWVSASALPEETKNALLGFLRRFPSLVLRRDDDAALDRLQQAQGLELPGWLRELRQTLGDFMPGHSKRLRFDRFEHSTPFADSLAQRSFTWHGITSSPETEIQRFAAAGQPLIVVASSTEGTPLLLALYAGRSDDQRVYVFARDNARVDQRGTGDVEPAALYPAFDSYASLLERVERIWFSAGVGEVELVAKS